MDKMGALLIKPHCHPKRVQISGELSELQAIVGGLIQAIYPYEDPVALILNDEGKLMNLEPNRALWDGDGQMVDYIAGDFLVVGLSDENFGSLPPELMDKYEQLFHWPEVIFPVGNGIFVVLKTGEE